MSVTHRLKLDSDMSQHEVLARLTRTLYVSSYLEVGVRDGATLWAVIEAGYESLQLVGVSDTWGDEHGGSDRGNHDHIDRLLSATLYYHRGGEVVWLDGDSAETLPAFHRDHPDILFDLVHIDGDHSEGHQLTDLQNGWDLTRCVLIAHDTNVKEVYDAWSQFIAEAKGVTAHDNFNTGRGIGIAMRL